MNGVGNEALSRFKGFDFNVDMAFSIQKHYEKDIKIRRHWPQVFTKKAPTMDFP